MGWMMPFSSNGLRQLGRALLVHQPPRLEWVRAQAIQIDLHGVVPADRRAVAGVLWN